MCIPRRRVYMFSNSKDQWECSNKPLRQKPRHWRFNLASARTSVRDFTGHTVVFSWYSKRHSENLVAFSKAFRWTRCSEQVQQGAQGPNISPRGEYYVNWGSPTHLLLQPQLVWAWFYCILGYSGILVMILSCLPRKMIKSKSLSSFHIQTALSTLLVPFQVEEFGNGRQRYGHLIRKTSCTGQTWL